MAGVTITVTENGPYRVDGPVELRDQAGNPIAVARSPVFLCRCGASRNKPFCDGTHSRIGFRGARRAVQAASA
jgi:3-phenylpropionate/trans-cinnamate dioxygenase ferredoxin subunit